MYPQKGMEGGRVPQEQQQQQQRHIEGEGSGIGDKESDEKKVNTLKAGVEKDVNDACEKDEIVWLEGDLHKRNTHKLFCRSVEEREVKPLL